MNPIEQQLREDVASLEQELDALRESHSHCARHKEKNSELSLEVVQLLSEVTRIKQEKERWRQRASSASSTSSTAASGSALWRQHTLSVLDDLIQGTSLPDSARFRNPTTTSLQSLVVDVLQYVSNVVVSAMPEAEYQKQLISRLRDAFLSSPGGGGNTPRQQIQHQQQTTFSPSVSSALAEQARMHFQSRMALLKELENLRTEVVVSGPDFHHLEVATLLHQIEFDEEIILKLCNDQHKSGVFMERILDNQHMRQLYEQQRERIRLLEAALSTSSSRVVVAHSDPSCIVPGDPNSVAMAMMRKFCTNSMRDIEKERNEWRSRCLVAEEQCAVLEKKCLQLEIQLE
eukprot:PhM_4_TR8828/c0_g1_i1/m.43580